MHLHLSDEQQMLRDSIARFARETGEAAPDAVLAGLTDLGLLALAAPEAVGGLGGGGDDVMVMAEAVGRGLLGSRLPPALAAIDLLGRCGTAAQQAAWVTPAIEGGLRLGFAVLDHAEAQGGRLSGHAAFAPGAGEVDAFVLVTGDAAWLAAAGSAGLSQMPELLVDGSGAGGLRLDGVAAEPIPAMPGQIADARARAAVAGAAVMLGIMERMLADTRDHVMTRQQFGVAIGTFQTIQHRMARLFVIVGQCRSLVMAAAAGGTGPRGLWLRQVMAAQAMVSEQAIRLAHECVQFHGGMGITHELAVTRGHRQLLVLSRQFGGAAQARRAFDRLSA